MKYHEYHEEIARIVEDILEDARSYCDSAREAEEHIDQSLHETIDGHSYVIYTHEAAMVLHHSSNEDAFFEEGMEASGWESYSDVVTQLAFFAMRQDVQEAMPDDWQEDLGSYFDDPILECPECGESYTAKTAEEEGVLAGEMCPECEEGTLKEVDEE